MQGLFLCSKCQISFKIFFVNYLNTLAINPLFFFLVRVIFPHNAPMEDKNPIKNHSQFAH
ncbi:MAG: hypothetical protein EAY66_08235 [Sphingobacteriales bacterium]|nr:MAG: hypothetical protein EAY66_08235 [Sphingobacteriales bacterium]